MTVVQVDASLLVDDAGVQRPLNVDDFKTSDPAAGPGARDATSVQTRDNIAAATAKLEQIRLVAVAQATEATLAAMSAKLPALVAGRLPVDGSGVTQPVSAAALPLPAGASSEAKLEAVRAQLAAGIPVATGLDLAPLATAAKQDAAKARLDLLATEATLSALSGKVGTPASDDLLALLRAIAANTATEVTRTDTLNLTADQVQLNTDQVEAKLDTVSARIGTTGIAGTVAALLDAIRQNQATEATLALLRAQLPATLAGGRLSVDGSGVTQPVSAVALPLPSGAATQTTLASVLAALQGTLLVDTELTAAGPLATQATLASVLAALQGTLTVDTELSAAGPLATEATEAAVLAKLSADPSTGAKQDTQATKLDTVHADLGTLNGKDFATQASLAAFLAANHTDLLAILAKDEAIRALLAGTLIVDTELSAAGPLATEVTIAAILTKLNATLAVTQSGAWVVDTELPAAAALSDADPRAPTTPTIGAALMGDDGTNLRRGAVLPGTWAASAARGAQLVTLGITDGTNYRPWGAASFLGDNSALATFPAAGAMLFNGTNFDRARSANGIADGASGVGISATTSSLWNGATWDKSRTPNVTKQISALAIGTEATIWTPTSGKKFRLMGYVLASSAAGTLTLRDNTAGTIIRTVLMQAGVPIVVTPPGNGTLSAAANNVLTATLSVAGNLTGYVAGCEE